jgi:hypothetical protein
MGQVPGVNGKLSGTGVMGCMALVVSHLLGCTEPRFRPDSDAAMESDAGHDGSEDAGNMNAPDAEPDPDQRLERAASLCGTDAGSTLPGDVCADSVNCGNAKACDVGTHNCCLAFGGFGDECSLDPCTVEGTVREMAECDGPEDCPFGTRCCFGQGSTACAPSCAPGGELCHGDPDCTQGRCAVGRPDALGLRFWVYWGFCEG